MHCLNGRVLKPELLDTLPPDSEDARASLADLVRINKYWGGLSTLRKLVDQVIPGDPSFSFLDVGAASGDMGRYLKTLRPRARVTSLDYLESHLRAGTGSRVAADAFALPFAAKNFDYVFSSLFLHHFSDDDVVRLLAEFGRVASRQVLIIDLWRHPIPYYFIGYTRPLFGWNPVSVSDGKISVEAAFRPRELAELARRAGLVDPRTSVYVPAFRIAMHASSK
jgi:2-polyprenyl-3-methyl-5-hydroxy-6-metoxy-1,4-benzoquinol methylase